MKLNKLNVGDLVSPKKKYIKWEIDHMVENFKIHGIDHQKAVTDFESIPKIAMWMAAASGLKTMGKVVGYGNSGSKNEPNCVRVIIGNKLGLVEEFLEEKDLILVKKAKKKK